MVVEHFPVIIVVISLISAFTILLSGLVSRKLGYYISLATVTFSLILSVILLQYVLKNGKIHYWLGGWRPPWGIEYVIDAFNAYVLVIVLFLSLVSTIYAKRSVEKEIEERKHPTFYTLWQLLIAGLCGVVVTGDMFNLFVFLEIASLAGYALIAIAGGRSLIASYNYLILGTVGICFYLLGTTFLYSVTGTLNMADLRILIPLLYENRIVQTAFVFFFIGLAIKMALFPFHTWQPDAYTYSPSAVTVLISTAMAKVNIYALIRVVFSVFTLEFVSRFIQSWVIILWISAAAIIAGSVFALMQYNLKRLLAYSSIAHVGYILLAASLYNTKWGTVAALVHILNHSLMKGVLFMTACGFIYKAGLRDIRDLEGLGRRMPFTSAAFTIAALSMIGIPPTVGFVTKLYIILASLEARQFVFIALIILSSLLSLAYFWRVIEAIYMKEGKWKERDEIPASMLIPSIVLAILCIVLGIIWLSRIPLFIIEDAVRALGVGI